ncbi:MAG: acetyl-CoA carboxylase biotin carboxylase subunit [Alphaproteobacteria bacterium]
MFDRILIANRGEIACRIARTCRRLGIASAAVYSDADAGARHVAAADEAWAIGGAAPQESYLAVDRILAAAKASGAQAVHPGYGFLSENADFAEACAAAGLVFIGPPPAAIRAMGSKSAAKRLMEDAGVPLVPGYHGEDQDPDRLAAEAARIGYPVLIKASAGGGGKGMRMVAEAEAFPAALESARREARAAFGDPHVLVEKYLTRARHVEVQVFADGHGNVVHLFERDCSIQRRHQKVVEEAPAPGLSDSVRTAMTDAALAAARAVGYVNAGTVEFILDADREDDPGGFYFMEMNTRLQVEHPVTEAITGIDLVEWQIRIAAGAPLPMRQQDIQAHGHAIEVRLYAEDPARDFLPQTGRLLRFDLPETMDVRVDAGVGAGDAVTAFYDPMIAKLVVAGPDREAAVLRLRAALAQTRLAGLRTNRDFLLATARHPDFLAGPVDTGFIEARKAALLPADGGADGDDGFALAALADQLLREQVAGMAGIGADPWSPWRRTDGWRLNGRGHVAIALREGERTVALRLRSLDSDAWEISLPDRVSVASGALDEAGRLTAAIDGRRMAALAVSDGSVLHLATADWTRSFHRIAAFDADAADTAAGGRLTAPMPGRVIAVSVQAGDRVRRGQTLLVLEAMKMEHGIAAPGDGRVARLHAATGDQVEEGALLVEFEAAGEGRA